MHNPDCPIGIPHCPECCAESKPPIFCDTGIMLNWFLPKGVGFRVDPMLPEGTIEVWSDGKRIGRIENIGSK